MTVSSFIRLLREEILRNPAVAEREVCFYAKDWLEISRTSLVEGEREDYLLIELVEP